MSHEYEYERAGVLTDACRHRRPFVTVINALRGACIATRTRSP